MICQVVISAMKKLMRIKERKHEREEVFDIRFPGKASLARQVFHQEDEVMGHMAVGRTVL